MREFHTHFDRLVTAWARHQDLRSAGAPVAVLADSGEDLARARLEIRSCVRSITN